MKTLIRGQKMDNMNAKKEEFNELKNMLKLLEPELHDLHALIKDMVAIDSPYKQEFNYLKVLGNSERMASVSGDVEKEVTLLVNEFNQFGTILNKIIEDDQVRDLYVSNGLMDRCIDLQKNLENKM